MNESKHEQSIPLIHRACSGNSLKKPDKVGYPDNTSIKKRRTWESMRPKDTEGQKKTNTTSASDVLNKE